MGYRAAFREAGMVDELKIAGWGPPPADLSLGDEEVHVWRGTVRATARELPELLPALSRQERRAADRHASPKAFVAACFMRRSLLGRYLGTDPRRLRLKEGADGRMVLARPPDDAPHWDFAWGDSRAVFAISATQPVAVHLEVIPEDLDVSELARDIPPREARLAEFLSPHSRARALAGYHAEREAIRRLGGDGSGSGGGPRVERLRLGKRFVAALAAEGWEWSPSFWQYGGGREEPEDD